MCRCAAVRRVGRGDDSGLLPGMDGRKGGATARLPHKEKKRRAFACLSRASSPSTRGRRPGSGGGQRCGPAASRDSSAAMRPGSSRCKPGGRSPEVPPRMAALLATLGDLVASVPRRPATRRCRPAGWPRHDSGQTHPQVTLCTACDFRAGEISAVIWSLYLGVFAVSAAGVLCAFSCVVDALSGQCLRRRTSESPLFAAVFRTKRLLR